MRARVYIRFHDVVSTGRSREDTPVAVSPFARSLRDLYGFLTSSLRGTRQKENGREKKKVRGRKEKAIRVDVDANPVYRVRVSHRVARFRCFRTN